MSVAHGGAIRVLWVTKGLGPGGAERLLVSFAQSLDTEKFEAQVAYLLPWKDHLVEEFESRGIPTICLQGAREFDPRWVRRLVALVRESRIDVVHFHSPLVAALARPALRLLPGRPVLIGTEHNMWSSHRRVTRGANRLTLSLQDATIAVSEEVRSSMSSRARARTEVVLHGVDVDGITSRHGERVAARTELDVGPDELLVVTVANLRSTKDYGTMLEAARLLVDRNVPCRFISVGQGPLMDELTERRDRLGLGGRFRFLGYRDDPIRALVAADVFCLSSRFEGLPIALLEAMAARVPVVVTRVGGIPSVVTDGIEGRLIEPGNPVELADAIQWLTDATERARCAAAALARSRAFDVTSAIHRQQVLYDRLARQLR